MGKETNYARSLLGTTVTIAVLSLCSKRSSMPPTKSSRKRRSSVPTRHTVSVINEYVRANQIAHFAPRSYRLPMPIMGRYRNKGIPMSSRIASSGDCLPTTPKTTYEIPTEDQAESIAPITINTKPVERLATSGLSTNQR